MDVMVLCPLYNASNYLYQLHDSLLMQKGIDNLKINYILTESTDNTESILKELNANYFKITKEEFSHSLTREKYILESNSNYVFLITQDVIIKDEYTLKKLLDYTKDNNLAGAYLRQVSTLRLDKYFREYSYSKENHIYTKEDLERIGQKAVFFSDTFSCIDVNTFKKLNGYDNKNLPTNEDMYYAYKALMNGYSMGYLGDTFCYHSHKLTYKATYNRYILIGNFFKLNKDIANLKSKKSDYFKIIGLILKRFDLISLFMLPFNVLARLKGMRRGMK